MVKLKTQRIVRRRCEPPKAKHNKPLEQWSVAELIDALVGKRVIARSTDNNNIRARLEQLSVGELVNLATTSNYYSNEAIIAANIICERAGERRVSEYLRDAIKGNGHSTN